ncbi:hypothetical protein ACSU6B_18115 [Neobacillus sp. C211]|uniref:hypothetical protein n=1 Tax=unclassified Neobacillus TaxID=2675272 RepID=UPI00397E350C
MNPKEMLLWSIDEVGGLKVFLSDGYKLEAFPDSSEDDEQGEHWRFFHRKKV